MTFKFKSRCLKVFNRAINDELQIKNIKDQYWCNGNIFEVLDNFNEYSNLLNDLNDFLENVEKGFYSGSKHAIAQTCREMTIQFDCARMMRLYQTAPHLMGIFLIRCMRVNNLATHSSTNLRDFKRLLGFLGIRVEGDWERCVELASFGFTSFANNTLTVELP